MTPINAFNFLPCQFPHHAARLASIRTSDLATLIERFTGTRVTNLVQKFPQKPSKCTAARYLTNGILPSAISDLETALLPLERSAQAHNTGNNPGKPILQFRHDADHVNNVNQARKVISRPAQAAQQSPVIETVSPSALTNDDIKAMENLTVADLEETQAQPKAMVLDNTGDPLRDAIRAEINDALTTLDIKADKGTDIETVNALIKSALQTHHRPNIVHIATTQADGTTITHNAGLQHKLFATLLQFVSVGYPVWIPGPAGSGKTTAVNNVAKALNAELFMPPEGPIENKYGMVGFQTATGTFAETTLYHACKAAAADPDKLVIYFIDECDAAYPNALLVLNAVMENGYCTFANGERVHFGRNLQFIAGANTFGNGATHEYVGRNKLDAATLDRFVTLAWDYDEDLERAITGNDAWVAVVQRIRAAVSARGIKQVVSPRASIRGAAMLAAGIDMDTVMRACIWKGMTLEQIRSVGVN